MNKFTANLDAKNIYNENYLPNSIKENSITPRKGKSKELSLK